MTKVFSKAVAIYAFFQTPQGKRDITIVSTAVGVVVSLLKQFGAI